VIWELNAQTEVFKIKIKSEKWMGISGEDAGIF
jgi:hypothetical protein